ncbi:MAG TPA: hypothetical protein VF498_21115 [Anaerolineales bacterium]
MAFDAVVVLESLSCLRLKNVESRTEPYIWPALIRVDDNTLNTESGVAVTGPFLGDARVVIKDSMREGETASIPGSVGIIRARFEDNLVHRNLILVVALFDEDETPEDAMKAGFQAFFSELGAAIAENLIALSQADEEQTKQITDEINTRVQDRVKSAVGDHLSAFEKAEVLAGTLNLDDPLGSDFKSFDSDELVPTQFTLSFEKEIKILGALSQFEIQGQLQIRPVVADRCQPQVDAVIEAQGVVNGIDAEIKELQDQLKGGGDGGEPPLPKDYILKEIRRIREQELKPAQAELKAARAALQFCRDRQGLVGDFQGGGVATA